MQKTIDTSTSTDEYTLYDSLGRPVSHSRADPDNGWDRTDMSYDSLGRVAFQSYPCAASIQTGAAVCTAGDTFAYDALGRPTTVTHSDQSQISYTYLGAATEVQDEGNGSYRVTRVYQHDGLGRLASVCEVTAATQAGTDGTPSSCGQDIPVTGFLTSYQYDTLGNLLQVNQGSLAARGFSYDPLSRMVVAFNPESGTTRYVYDSDGNLLTRVRPAPNQTDPNVTVTTTYSYDALNRLLSKTYSDGTPTASYVYDWSSAAGISLTNTVGRLALERTTNASGQTLTEDIFSYDALGRVASNWQDPGNGPLYPFAYGYDLLGDITQQSQPTDATATSFTLSGAWNRAGRLTGLTSSYANTPTHPSTLLSAVHYDAWGHVTALSTTSGAINETRRYDGRGRLWETRGNPYYVVWEQYYAPDGAVTTLEDAANGNWSYTYDALNRLLTANCSANCPGGQASLALGWSYDRLGNRWSQAPTAGTAPAASASFTGNTNRLDGASYDDAGNLLASGTVGQPDYHTYTYDAENRLIGVDGNATASYAYDAEGRRVSTTVAGVTRLRFFDEQGRTVRRIAASGQWLSSEIYALGQPLATYDQSGANGMTWFMDVDPVGTIRTITDGSGQFAQACTSLPFGDDQACSPAISDPSPLHFTGKPRDPETGLDYFGFRYNSSTLGRWMTPDPAGTLVVNPGNPQSWNQYAYVLNNPATLIDPAGLLYCQPPNNKGESNCIPDSDWMKLSEEEQDQYTYYPSTDDGKQSGSDVTSNAFADLIALLRASQIAQRQAWIQQAQARPTSEDYMRAIQNRLGQFPTLCGPAGVFAYAGYGSKGGVGADVLIEYDGKTGLSAGPLLEAGHGGVAGGGAATVGKGGLHGEGLVFVGEEAGVFSTLSKTPQIGPYLGASVPGTGIGAGIGAYATLTSVAGCHN